MKNDQLFVWVASIIFGSHSVLGTEFTFEIADNDQQCFFEVVKEKTECQFDFQVVSGGELDVDVTIEAPNREIIYKELRKEHDTIHFNSTEGGEYAICFSNEFSSFTHKTVFLSFVVGDENSIFKGQEDHFRVMTFMEVTAEGLHNSLSQVVTDQTHFRLQEATGRRFAEELNERVLWWSLMQTFVIFAISISTTLILRNFFNEPRMNKPVIPPRQPRYGYPGAQTVF